MEIARVIGDVVCTRRVPGLYHCSLRLLKSVTGSLSVATDPVGVPPGKWVFATAGSAARYAMQDATTITDLTICGIIDGWDEDEDGRG
ncbi:MAG: carboxysome peptide B [Rhodocyclaceae bacterium]|nr:carboxysome peptide B [Rhodocyclaceae bacterium]